MATNDFLLFATDGAANVETQVNYASDVQRPIGHQPGIARADFANKAARQSSIMSTVLAQYICDITTANAIDDGTTATLLADLKLATKGMIGANIASASTVAIGGDNTGDIMHITGTTTITSLGTSVTGRKKSLIFDGILTLTHNATSLILPGAANITTSAGSVANFICIDGALGYWKCIGYSDDVISKSQLKTYFDTLYFPIPTSVPRFSAYSNTVNQSISSGVYTKIQFNVEEYDTTNAYDNATNYRFSPTVAGYYQVSLKAYIGSTATSISASGIALFKNGSIFKQGSYIQLSAAANVNMGVNLTAEVYMNGTTDYLEGYAIGTGTSIVIVGGNTYYTYFQANYKGV